MVTHLVFDGVADGPLGVALDVMSTAARLLRSGLVNVPTTERAVRQRVVSVDGKPVRTGAGRLLPVDGAFTARGLHAGDVVAMPGLGAATEAQAAALLTRPDILRAIALLGRAPTKRVVLAASCSATFVLAASGALDGKQATTTWWLGAAFARRFTRVTLRADKMVIDAGEVLTAGSAFAHADLMLAIVARTLSPSLAHMVARYLVLDERISQARYMVTEHLRGADPTVRELEAFVLANIERQVSVHEMARATATSPRTLARRVEDALGTTPHHLAQRLRVARAVQLLETTGDSVENIAARVGYADAAAFRRVFRRETGEAPRTSRASGFRQAARS
ncbi:Transcriptional regulator, AraC family [Myxococcus hansupus]|uniref:Transcriptional regulator, AraC family n=2 Tax=Pseudomyxococcus hansupus TaxID=1297742 RepID=A0A0H4X7G8_9BACT|nr:Transcriptional regulator, AraC family [Myxococcus hansupus]